MDKLKKMVLRQVPENQKVVRKFISSTVPLREAGTDAGSQPTKAVYTLKGGFVAGGKVYRNLQQLTAQETDIQDLYRDIYGREVLYLRERFPCFDSFDYLHENRYFRWFYLLAEGTLTEVYFEDERPTVTVTENIQDVRQQWRDKIQDVWG